MNKIKILNLAFTDMGGAGKSTLVFNEMFNTEEYQSVLLVKESSEVNRNVIILPKKRNSFVYKFYRKQKERFKFVISHYLIFVEKYFFFNYNERSIEITHKEIIKAIPFVPDVIFLHWITGFINTRLISELEASTKAKIFWIMMDNAPLTGGCHYPWDCKGFFTSCSNCPAIKISWMKKIAVRNLEYKKQYTSPDMVVVTCSSTDYERAASAAVFRNNSVYKIFLPIDENKFITGDIALAKKYFSIPLEKKVIFYGASNIKNTRKGLLYFVNAILLIQNTLAANEVSLEDFIILIAGNVDLEIFDKIKIPIVSRSFLSEENLIKAYQSATVFVSTSVEDSGPLMVNQAIMCGTPVISFNIGVAVDLVKNDETGYLSDLYDTESLANNICKLLLKSDLEYSRMSENCRELALKNFSFESAIKKYNQIIKC